MMKFSGLENEDGEDTAHDRPGDIYDFFLALKKPGEFLWSVRHLLMVIERFHFGFICPFKARV